MHLYAATKNLGKLRELRAIFAGFGCSVSSFEAYEAPVEGETSYAENAALKARALAGQLRRAGIRDAAVVGDDSGLEVTALGGRPGVLSARYGGPDTSWSERRRRLLEELASVPSGERGARFVCAMHLVAADGMEYATQAAVDGAISPAEQGSGGFSYDAIFGFPPLRRTFGELTEQEKNAVSHRALAARALAEHLSAHEPDGM